MSLTHYSPTRNRVYVRKFDHEEAAARHAGGESIPALAREYGVSDSAVRWVVTPGGKDRNLEGVRRWRDGTCEDCGGPAMRLVGSKAANNRDGRTICHRCRSDRRRERLRFDEYGQLASVRCVRGDCAYGQRWQPPEHFPGGMRHRDVRAKGIANECRSCQARQRRRRRDALRVPCEDCGTPTSPAGSPDRNQPRALCPSCAPGRLGS